MKICRHCVKLYCVFYVSQSEGIRFEEKEIQILQVKDDMITLLIELSQVQSNVSLR